MANQTSNFRVGDMVKVVNQGQNYTTYRAWAYKYGLKDYASSSLPDGDTGRVVAVGPHGDSYFDTLVGVEAEDGKQYIIGHRGVELVKPRGLQVGDVVIVVDYGWGVHIEDMGKVTVITKVLDETSVAFATAGFSGDRYLSPSDTAYVKSFERIDVKPLDFTKPMETYEGTPVKLLATGGVDAKFPVLVLEGSATIPTKYDLNGKAKNGVVRRFIRNVAEKPKAKAEPRQKKEVSMYMNFYSDGTYGLLQESREEADRVAVRGSHVSKRKRIGVSKVVLLAGKFDE
jgi:hypothetical protein